MSKNPIALKLLPNYFYLNSFWFFSLLFKVSIHFYLEFLLRIFLFGVDPNFTWGLTPGDKGQWVNENRPTLPFIFIFLNSVLKLTILFWANFQCLLGVKK